MTVRALRHDRSSYQVPQQFPSVYRDEGPSFVEFTESFFSWLETDGPGYKTKRLLEYGDVDETLDELLPHFVKKYLHGMPAEKFGDKRFVVKHVLDVYRSKGSIEGLKLLFRLLFSETPTVYVPSKDVLKPSDGKWYVPKYFEVSYSARKGDFFQQYVVGKTSGATAIVEDVVTYRIRGRERYVMYVSNVVGDFSLNEVICCDSVPLADSPYILGSVTSAEVVSGVADRMNGDLFTSVDGSGSGLGSSFRVKATSTNANGIITFSLVSGGYGYTLATPIVIVGGLVTDEDDTPLCDEGGELIDFAPGSEANVTISTLSNTVSVEVSDTVLAPYEDDAFTDATITYEFLTMTEDGFSLVTDDTLEYLVSAVVHGSTLNEDVVINEWENVSTIEVGSIGSIAVHSIGTGYSSNPSIYVVNDLVETLGIPDLTGGFWGSDAEVTGNLVKGSGYVTGIKVVDSGFSYSDGEYVKCVSDDGAEITVSVTLNSVGYGVGTWVNTDGMLNADKYIHDSYYYQEYSYDVVSSMSLDYYEDTLRAVYHPAGTELFGTAAVGGTADNRTTVTSEITQT